MAETVKAVSKIFIRGSIETVWHEITKTDELQRCFFNMRLHTQGLKAGAAIQMRTPNGKYVDVVGEVLEFDPPYKYSHTFRFTSYDDAPCTVTYELKEVAGGVEFTLTSDGIPAGSKTAKQMVPGGDMITKALKAIIESGKPPLGHRIIFGVLAPMMAPFRDKKKTAAGNFPL